MKKLKEMELIILQRTKITKETTSIMLSFEIMVRRNKHINLNIHLPDPFRTENQMELMAIIFPSMMKKSWLNKRNTSSIISAYIGETLCGEIEEKTSDK